MPLTGTAGLFAGLWFVLASVQSYRSFARCHGWSAWDLVLWGIQAALLVAPLAALARLGGPGREPSRIDPAIALALLTYVPLALAMRLMESCAGR
jgi:hypothetical protein